MSDVLYKKGLHAPFGDGVTKNTRVVSDDFPDAVHLDLGQSNVEIPPERSKLSNEIIAAPQTTRVDVVSDKDARDSRGSHGHNLSIRLGHKVDEGTEGKLVSLNVAKLVPSVVSGVPVNYRDVRSNAVMLTRRGQSVGGFTPDWTTLHPPPSLVRRTQFSATPFVCGMPVVAVDNLHFNAVAAAMSSGALSQ